MRRWRAGKAGGLVPISTRFILPDVTVVEPESRRLEHVDVVVSDGRIADIRPTAAPDAC